MLNRMRLIAAVVEHKSVNKAAQALNISQPALSRHIAALEKELNVKLFHRRGKRLELTRAGQMAYEFAKDLNRLEQRFLNRLEEFTTANRGKLTIGASLTTLQSTLPELIAAFTKEVPDVDIQTVTGKTHEIVSLVKEKKCDIGLVASAVNTPDTVCVPLFDDHLALVLPERHPLSAKEKIRLHDLERLPMILFSKGSWYRDMTDELFSRSGVQPDVRMEIDSFEVTVRLMAACNLAALLPQSYLRSGILEDNACIVKQVPEIAHITRTTCLLYAKNDALSPAANQLISLAKRAPFW